MARLTAYIGSFLAVSRPEFEVRAVLIRHKSIQSVSCVPHVQSCLEKTLLDVGTLILRRSQSSHNHVCLVCACFQDKFQMPRRHRYLQIAAEFSRKEGSTWKLGRDPLHQQNAQAYQNVDVMKFDVRIDRLDAQRHPTDALGDTSACVGNKRRLHLMFRADLSCS